MKSLILAALLAAAPMAAAAQEAASACPVRPPPLPANLRPWSRPAPLTAAAAPAEAGEALLKVGQAADAALPATGEVTYALRPEKPGGSVSHGGLFALQIDRAGDYVVAIGSGAWIDVLRDGKAVPSNAHGRGPCGGPLKMVTFPMTPGRYLIQISANGAARLEILVTPAS